MQLCYGLHNACRETMQLWSRLENAMGASEVLGCMLTRLMPRLREDDATMAPVPHRARMVPHIIALPGVN